MKHYLQYLVILLDDLSVPFCHADNPLTEGSLIPLETLRKAVLFGMKENLSIQFVYPEKELPDIYETEIEKIDHVKIGRDIQVLTKIQETMTSENVILRLTIGEFIGHASEIALLLHRTARLNLCFTDVWNFTDDMQGNYSESLVILKEEILRLRKKNASVQVNLLTDRLELEEMNNCEAGIRNITLAPNGKFYLCPAFYYDEKMGVDNCLHHSAKSSACSVGDLDSGLQIPDRQLLRLDHAPICRNCDAYQCRRCIWLNRKLTWDANTPSRQQCVMSHLERNVSRELLDGLTHFGFKPKSPIDEISYLDPFEIREKFQ